MRNNSHSQAATSPGDPIAVLRSEHEELARTLRIKFRSGHDDLDWLRMARIRTADGRTFALIRHRHAPQTGTEVVAAAPSRNVWADIAAVLERLNLTRSSRVTVRKK